MFCVCAACFLCVQQILFACNLLAENKLHKGANNCSRDKYPSKIKYQGLKEQLEADGKGKIQIGPCN